MHLSCRHLVHTRLFVLFFLGHPFGRFANLGCRNPPNNFIIKALLLMMQDQPERGLRVLAKLKKLNLMPDIRTYELLFSLFGNVNAPYEDANLLSRADAAKRINTIEMDMIKNGIQHSHVSMHNLVSISIHFN